MKTRRLVVLLALLVASPSAWAWTAVGHRVICETAFQLLPQEQQTEVAKLVSDYQHPDGQRYETFADACNFADTARELAEKYRVAAQEGKSDRAAELERWKRFVPYDHWHFLDASRDAREVSASDCNDDCVLTGIERHGKELGDRSLDPNRRAEALLLLGHWIGDLHQPLHVSYVDDEHGGTILTEGFYGAHRLFDVWDTRIVDRKSRSFERIGRYVEELRKQITAAEQSEWTSTDPLAWANESYAIVTQPGFRYCRWDGGRCVSMEDVRRLGDGYRDESEKVVDDTIRRAAVRLAARIQQALQE